MYLNLLLLLTTISTSLLLQSPLLNSLGSSSTVSITSATPTVCAITAGDPIQTINCFRNGQTFSILPNVSFQALSGGNTFFCGLKSGGLTVFCWDTFQFHPKRIYHSENIQLVDLAVGVDHVCAREVNSGIAKCWRGKGEGRNFPFPWPGSGLKFRTLTSGNGFTCGILRSNSTVHCWGNNDDIAAEIQTQFSNLTMLNLVAGETHVCGLKNNGFLVCKGSNVSGELQVPFSSPFEYSRLALGSGFSCAIKERNGFIKCWGDTNKFRMYTNEAVELVVSGLDFICGVTTNNLSVICRGSGWSYDNPPWKVLPGPCVKSSCTECGLYPDSEGLCGGSRNTNICKSCQIELPIAVPLPPRTERTSRVRNKLSLAFVIVGSVGTFAGSCAVIYCFVSFLCRKRHSLVQPSIINASGASGGGGAADLTNTGTSITTSSLRSYSTRRYSSSRLGRQRSESSCKLADKIQNFCLSELVAATDNFSLANKIGSGSFGIVYKGRLVDGRRVAIKRGETKIFQDRESAFDSELALLSRLHHKHLVDLIGFCEEGDERLLVYEYMSNGALHDHLHNNNNVGKSSSFLNSWKVRIKIALDAARGLEYLHNYAVPPIIHRDIKSSNILLDRNWSARVSDFGLSLMGPESDGEFMSTKAVGTVGYIDPEYYVLNVLTAKSDVYGFGVVLLELLTGKKAVFKNDSEDRVSPSPMEVVEYAIPHISSGELHKVLDKRVGSPEIHEAEAVELMAYTATRCVKLEGRERPNVVDIVANLERALAMCEETPASLSPNTFSIPSD